MGNRNAFKHGLYAAQYTHLSSINLERMPPLESQSEINMLLAELDDILTLIQHCDSATQRFKLYDSLFTGTKRLSAAMRAHTNPVDKNQQLLTKYWEALDLFWQEHGLQS